jgi:glutamyl-tRNA synthetase
MQLLYTAVEGRRAGLPLFEGIYLLGRERSLARLAAALERVGSDPKDSAG